MLPDRRSAKTGLCKRSGSPGGDDYTFIEFLQGRRPVGPKWSLDTKSRFAIAGGRAGFRDRRDAFRLTVLLGLAYASAVK